jgi:hypothetical protein
MITSPTRAFHVDTTGRYTEVRLVESGRTVKKVDIRRR